MISAKIIAHSKNPKGIEIVTFVVTCHRYILAEFNTHRMLSRNSASSRAIPSKKLIANVWNNPALPIAFGQNCKGMQAKSNLSGWQRWFALKSILLLSKLSCLFVMFLTWLGVHKQIANRYLEPYLFTTIIVTATDWGNFFNLRAHKDAQPEFQELAFQMLEVLQKSSPKLLKAGEWHLPFADAYLAKDLCQEDLLKIVTARCARVSYATFEGDIDHEKDFKLHDDLQEAPHASPFEHAGEALDSDERSGNFRGYRQYRKTIKNENRLEFDPVKLLENR